MIDANAGSGTSYTDEVGIGPEQLRVPGEGDQPHRGQPVVEVRQGRHPGGAGTNTHAHADTQRRNATATPEPEPASEPDPEDLGPGEPHRRDSGRRVALSWDAPAEDAKSVTGYEVSGEWTAAGMPNALIALIDSVATAWTDRTGKEAGVSYTYWVRAVRDGERSGWSNAAHVDLPGDGVEESGG